MKIEIHHYHHYLEDDIMDTVAQQIGNKLNHILKLLQDSKQREISMANELDTLSAGVTENGTVIGSAITLIQNIAAMLAAAGTDPVKLAELAATLKANTDALANAVVANTPVVPA